MLAQSSDARDLQRLTKMSDFDKYTLTLVRQKNQKYKIFSGNTNLENNVVNKLVNSNYM